VPVLAAFRGGQEPRIAPEPEWRPGKRRPPPRQRSMFREPPRRRDDDDEEESVFARFARGAGGRLSFGRSTALAGAALHVAGYLLSDQPDAPAVAEGPPAARVAEAPPPPAAGLTGSGGLATTTAPPATTANGRPGAV